MRNDDHSYFVRRAMEERKAANLAVCPQVAAAHRELAERYAALTGIPEQRNDLDLRAG